MFSFSLRLTLHPYYINTSSRARISTMLHKHAMTKEKPISNLYSFNTYARTQRNATQQHLSAPVASIRNAGAYFRGGLALWCCCGQWAHFFSPASCAWEREERWIRLHPCTGGVGEWVLVLATTALGEWHGDLDITCVWRSGKEGGLGYWMEKSGNCCTWDFLSL
jgi:hypothetical protein